MLKINNRTFKITLTFVLCFTFIVSTFGCSQVQGFYDGLYSDVVNQIEEASACLSLDLVKVVDWPEGSYYMEPVTHVMYLWVSSGYKGGLSVMLDSTGVPLTYEHFLELYNSVIQLQELPSDVSD